MIFGESNICNIVMPAVKCPIDKCKWKSQKLDSEFSQVLTIALQTHLSHAHPCGNTVAKPEKQPRPSVSNAPQIEGGATFRASGIDIKLLQISQGNDACTQLLACCESNLHWDLHRTERAITDKSLDAIMRTIKSLCIRQENVIVSRLTLHNMCQDRDEGIRNFAARLRGQAEEWKVVKCVCDPATDVVFMDQMVRDVLIRGLSDLNIQ